MKALLAVLFLFPIFAYAQGENTGHGGRLRSGHGRHQMQQQQEIPSKRSVIEGEAAEKLLESKHLTAEDWQDWSDRCSEPVFRSIVGRHSVCFDRGEFFTRGSRFKCYLAKKSKQDDRGDHGYRGTKVASGVDVFLFDLFHNSCGGDGIYPIRRKQQ